MNWASLENTDNNSLVESENKLRNPMKTMMKRNIKYTENMCAITKTLNIGLTRKLMLQESVQLRTYNREVRLEKLNKNERSNVFRCARKVSQ